MLFLGEGLLMMRARGVLGEKSHGYLSCCCCSASAAPLGCPLVCAQNHISCCLLVVWEASSSPLLACWPCTNLVLVEPGGPCIGGSPISPRSVQECMWLFLGIGDTVLFMFLQKLYLKAKFGQHLKLLK